MRRALLLILLLTGLCAGQAQAAQPVDYMPTWKAAAVQFWGHGKLPGDCTTIDIAWGRVAVHGDFAEADGPCHITFDVKAWHAEPDPGARCVVVVHEIGHLYGKMHTRRGVMAPSMGQQPAWDMVKPCRLAMADDGFGGYRLRPFAVR